MIEAELKAALLPTQAKALPDALRALGENAPMIGHYALNSTGGAVCGGKVEYLIIPVQ